MFHSKLTPITIVTIQNIQAVTCFYPLIGGHNKNLFFKVI